MHFLTKSVDFIGSKKILDRTEPKFLRFKMYPNKVICEMLEEFCGVTAPGKIIKVSKQVSQITYMHSGKQWKVWILLKFELNFFSSLKDL